MRKISRKRVNTKDPQLKWADVQVYTAWHMTTQYIIHSVPDTVDAALHRLAKQGSKSINTVVVEALARGLELDVEGVRYDDLDSLIGTWQDDAAFDEAIANFERTDEASS